MGYSDFSDVTSAAMAPLPDQANAPTKITWLSTNTSIALQWTANTNNYAPGGSVTGYKLYMDNGLNGDFTTIYYG
jgi:hypothetical protein